MNSNQSALALEVPYFITFSTVGMVDVFVRKEYNQIILDVLRQFQKKKRFVLHAWCIMSSHVHLIVAENEKFPMSDVMQEFKEITAVQMLDTIVQHPTEPKKDWLLRIFKQMAQRNCDKNEYLFWQDEYYPVLLSDAEEILEKLHFMHYSPVKNGTVKLASQYRYSSARDYEHKTEKGLLEVTLL